MGMQKCDIMPMVCKSCPKAILSLTVTLEETLTTVMATQMLGLN